MWMTRLSIPDMNCGHCKAAVTAALTAVAGVVSVRVDLDDRTAQIDGAAPLAELLSALDRAGYPASATA
jgi:copper chaperone CopZ